MPRLILTVLLALSLAACTSEQPRGPVVLAASSLQDALTAAADAWAAQGHARPTLSFAGSPVLARQVESGAPADIVFLADERWMDDLDAKGLLAQGTRRALFGNRLVLVAPVPDNQPVSTQDFASLVHNLGDQRLAMADPDTVPAGRYGKAALVSLGLWDAVKAKIAPTENVRAALALVERGEAPLGLVYDSDLFASSRVRLAAALPASAQPPIQYPVAILAGSKNHDTHAFLDFLSSSQAAQIFQHFRFTRLAQQ